MKQRNKRNAKSVNTDLELLRCQRDVAWQLYTAVHDELEVLEWQERRTESLFQNLVSISERLQSLGVELVTELGKQRNHKKEAQQRFSNIDRIYWPLYEAAAAAGLPDPTTDYAAAIARMKLSKRMRHGAAYLDALKHEVENLRRITKQTKMA